jgi:hypothetical protein
VVAKKHPGQLKFPEKAHVQKDRPRAKAKGKKKLPTPREVRNRGWMISGFDVSMSSMAGAAIAYDSTLKKFRGPEFVMHRWTKEDHYFDRLRAAAKSHELIQELQGKLGIMLELNEVFIAQEEPFPPHGNFMKGKMGGAYMKQQAEISGAFLGGLLRWGYDEIWQMGNQAWRGVIASDLGITTHHSKWKDPALCEVYNCKPADTGKFRAKQWALSSPGPGYAFMGIFSEEITDWPDIIESGKLGKIPRPENSKAKAVQPDDRYDALAIMWALYLDLENRDQLVGLTK